MSKRTKKNPMRKWIVVLIAIVALMIAAVMILPYLPDDPDVRPTQTTADTTETPTEAPTQQDTVPQTTSGVQIELVEQEPVNLGYGMEITDVGSYTGIYMEDGTNDVVSGVMMLVVENKGETDVQYAKIIAACGEEEYNFELTNLPAGERVVLLELDRKEKPIHAPVTAVAENAVLFSESMDLHTDTLKIGGLDGMLNLENISGSDISGDIYVYYKYSAADVFYGGITFRVRLEGGLKADELRQIPAGHFDPDGCTIIHVEILN